MKSLVEFITEARETKRQYTPLEGDQFSKLTDLLVPILEFNSVQDHVYEKVDKDVKKAFENLYKYCKDNLTPIDVKTSKSVAGNALILNLSDNADVTITWESGSWSDGEWNFIYLGKRGDRIVVNDSVRDNEKYAHRLQYIDDLRNLKDKSKYLVYNLPGENANDNPFLAANKKCRKGDQLLKAYGYMK